MPRCLPMAALVALCCAGPAWAADKPPSVPSVDATVVYRVMPLNRAAQEVRVYFGRHGELLRVDGPNGEGDTVLDRATGRLTVVRNDTRTVTSVPSNGRVTDPFLLDPANDYRRAGTRQSIAGLACEDWAVSSSKGHANVCVTSTGLLLSAGGVDGSGASGRIEAVSVSTAPLPPSIFEAPAGYRSTEAPGGQP